MHACHLLLCRVTQSLLGRVMTPSIRAAAFKRCIMKTADCFWTFHFVFFSPKITCCFSPLSRKRPENQMCGGDWWEPDSPASSRHWYEHSRPPVSCYMEESSREFEANLFKFQTLCGLVFLLCSTFTTTSTPALIHFDPQWSLPG